MAPAYRVRKTQGGGQRRKGRTAPRSTFTTARVADVVDEDVSEEALDASFDGPESSDESSDSEEDLENSQTKSNAYNALLQSLQPVSKGQPPRKRRKTSHVDNDGGHIITAPSENHVQDTSDLELGTANAEGADGSDAVDAGAEDDDVDSGDMLSDADSDADPDSDQNDPFDTHFANPDSHSIDRSIKAFSGGATTNVKLPSSKNIKLSGVFPDDINYKTASRDIQKYIKKRLQSSAHGVLDDLSPEEKSIVPPLFEYKDLLYGGSTPKNIAKLRQLIALHTLNHLFKTRDRVIKNNAKLAIAKPDADLDLRDQGFTRPKVLILQETRSGCAKMVETIMSICNPEQQENKKRFQDTFIDNEHTIDEDRPEDFRELFEGNDDNEFRVGLKFTRKTAKFFSKFYNSDIIFASPLGLRRAIDKVPKHKDNDFLSSIELLIVDQADAILMQNWEHVEYIFSHLNQQPKDAHGCDFSRVRHWYLDGHASYLRQTIILSAYLTPELNSLSTKHTHNIFGKIRYQPLYPGEIETIGLHSGLRIPQTFSRFPSTSPAQDPDARFSYFKSAILPSLLRHPKPSTGGHGILVFISSYFDFVRVRQYFASDPATQNISFGLISEYTSATDVRRARSHFLSGRHSVLLYTGRAHHFRRYNLRGVKRVVMYSLPENPIFYSELVGFVGTSIMAGEVEPGHTSVKAAFSKWDVMKLERVVGSKRVGAMVKEGGGDVFDFA